jgi:glycosyltransferase involved in cell wall biosynthesis
MRVSIITPNLNSGQYIEENILSVFYNKQQHKNIEHIIIDGMSNDESHCVIKKHSDKIDAQIIERDHGTADAVQKGISISTGDILCILPSNDMLLPGSVRDAVLFLQGNKNVGAVYGDRLIVDDKTKPINARLQKRFYRWQLLFMCGVNAESCFFRRSSYYNSGGIDKYMTAFDYDLWIKLNKTTKIKHRRSFWGIYRQHEHSISVEFKSDMYREADFIREQHKIQHPLFIRSFLKKLYFFCEKI